MKKILLVMFISVLILVPALTLLAPREDYSESEGRVLARPPEWDGERWLDGSLQADTEAWLSDHLPFREGLTAAQTALELASGKREVGGVYVGKDRLMENIAPPDDKQTILNLEAINDFAARHPGQSVFFALVPTAAQVYEDEAPYFAEPFDQAEYIQTLYGAARGVRTVDLLEPLSTQKKNYVYYRTDRHWTSYGAFVGYQAMAKPLGFNAADHDLFNIEHASYNYLGSLYAKARVGASLRDNIDLYEYSLGNVIVDVIRHEGRRTVSESSVLFRENLESRDPLTVFLGPNAPVVDIETAVEPGRRLLVFGDSFARPLAQFLPLHYESVTFVDLQRLNTPLTDYLEIDDYTQVLFLYSVDGFASSPSLPKVTQY